jgi:tetratricopeptide (TPR) repeat protein
LPSQNIASGSVTVAAEAVQRVEQKTIRRPTEPLAMFWLGKLYADQGRDDDALAWYAGAVDGFHAAAPVIHRSYARWAGRFLARRAWDTERYEEAAKQYARLEELGDAGIAELDRLAMARVHIGQYRLASRAWNAALRKNPADGNRPRYCQQLALRADEIAPLPETTPGGRAWETLTRADLEALLREQFLALREIMQQAQQEQPLKHDRRRELQGSADAVQPIFVKAALEFALRGLPIREAAFQGGYAPLIFRAREWRIP